MQEYCPPLFEFPAQPIAWKNVHLIYSIDRSPSAEISPDYICFDTQSCSSWPFPIRIAKISDPTIVLSCQMTMKAGFIFNPGGWEGLLSNVRVIFRSHCALIANYVENACPETTHFQCGKKCLSKHRLVDNIKDSSDESDEFYNNTCPLHDKHRIHCVLDNRLVYTKRCIVRVFAMNPEGKLTCTDQHRLPHFPTLCDSYVEDQNIINGQIETDEMNCEAWVCDNQYTRCDDIWNCLNGADEIHCPRVLCRNTDAHPCLSWNSSQPFSCLPISRAGDAIVDCLGATDERQLCRDEIEGKQGSMYRCWDNYSSNEQMMNK